jgi:NAD(P)-dependent dehydrogenase (short-subunit alcohol dehydrogenase family)
VAARLGARVAFTWSGNEDGRRGTEEAVVRLGAECEAINADLRREADCEDAVRRVIDRWQGIDVLINNAGVSEAVPFILLEDADVEALFEINLMAPVRLVRTAARSMVATGYGRVVNVSSITGSRAIPGPAHYAASKGALEAVTRSLAQELGRHGVLVNAIAAGIFEGGLRSTIPEHHQARYRNACALGRQGRPEECGELACWLGSRSNTYVNGTVVFQDGGTLA